MTESSKERLKKMLEGDKEELSVPTRAAALKEFSRVAEEFFEPVGKVMLDFTHGTDGKEVTVRFSVARVKNFTVLK